MKKEKSCGTIIVSNNKVLIIKQVNGFYGFPKGHVEEGETEVETAIRETKEETNIDVIVDESLRFIINYNVKYENEEINKDVVLFIAKPLNYDIKKQESEIDNIEWIDIDEVEEVLTFSNLKKLWMDVKNNVLDKK